MYGTHSYNQDNSMMTLTGKQRRYLRARANRLEPMVMIGKQGLTGGVMEKIEESLNSHELIKVKFIEFKETKKELVERIVRESGAVLAGMIGHVAILYRPHPDPDKRTITLPEGVS